MYESGFYLPRVTMQLFPACGQNPRHVPELIVVSVPIFPTPSGAKAAKEVVRHGTTVARLFRIVPNEIPAC